MARLTSFPLPFHVALIGHSGGIGRALLTRLLKDPAVAGVTAGARRGAGIVHAKLTEATLDIADEPSISEFAKRASQTGPLRLVVCATGLLHDGDAFQPEKSLRALDAARLARGFAVNAIGPALVAKHFLPLFPRDGKCVFAALSARVGSISDNRLGGWYGYRASKAALNMLIKTLGIEIAPRWPEAICVGLHPGTVDTDLSQPFQRGVAAEKLFTPTQSAAHLLGVIDRLTPADSGRLFAWDGAEIAP